MSKLVRDKIPDVIHASGRKCRIRTLDEAEFERALLAKLLEEAHELHDATPSQRLEEAADVLEVLLAIAKLHGSGLEDICERANAKRVERGAFDRRICLES